LDKKGKIYTRKVIAQVLGLSEKRIKQLTEDGIIPEYSDGNYKLLPAVQGYIQYLQSQLANDGQATDLTKEKAQLTRIKREDAELSLQLKRNDLHQSADVEFIMTNMVIAFKAKLEVLPYKVLSPILNAPDGDSKKDYLIDVLKAAVEEALEELSGYDPEYFDEEAYLTRLEGDGRNDETEEDST